jgi:very-short-patch-repair endonuclease
MPSSNLEERFLEIWRDEQHRHNMHLPYPEREYFFKPGRRWRFDFAWPDLKVAVEIEGGLWVKGRHNTATGMLNDMDKYNEAVVGGWKVLRFGDRHLKCDDKVFDAIMRVMGAYDDEEDE